MTINPAYNIATIKRSLATNTSFKAYNKVFLSSKRLENNKKSPGHSKGKNKTAQFHSFHITIKVELKKFW